MKGKFSDIFSFLYGYKSFNLQISKYYMYNINLDLMNSLSSWVPKNFNFNFVKLVAYYFKFMQNWRMRKKCPYSQLFWSAFFIHFPAFGLNTERYSVSPHIQSECGKMLGKCGLKQCPCVEKVQICKTFQGLRSPETLQLNDPLVSLSEKQQTFSSPYFTPFYLKDDI